jgi:hypothetical protein
MSTYVLFAYAHFKYYKPSTVELGYNVMKETEYFV